MVAEATNILLLGPAGVGRTHLAVSGGGLGQEGHRAGLRGPLRLGLRPDGGPAQGQGGANPDRRLGVCPAPKVLVVDEFGIWPYDRDAATALFTLVSAGYERGSIILTSNEGFGEWGELLGGTVIASAVLDRLLHHSHVLKVRGGSHRLREKRQSGIFSSHHLLGTTPANGNDNYPD